MTSKTQPFYREMIPDGVSKGGYKQYRRGKDFVISGSGIYTTDGEPIPPGGLVGVVSLTGEDYDRMKDGLMYTHTKMHDTFAWGGHAFWFLGYDVSGWKRRYIIDSRTWVRFLWHSLRPFTYFRKAAIQPNFFVKCGIVKK